MSRSAPSARPARARRTFALACALALSACGAKPPAAQGPAAPVAVAPMDLGGQKVLILPIQASSGLGFNREDMTTELVAALQARDSRTQWVTPERLRRSLRQSPNFAPDPAALPNDPYMVNGTRRIGGALWNAVRRYMALTEARVVIIPRTASMVTDSAGARVRMNTAVVDARTGVVVWFGEADGQSAAATDRALITTVAEAMAARMVVPDR